MKQTLFSIVIIIGLVVGVVFLLQQKVSEQNNTDETINVEEITELGMIVVQEGTGEMVLSAGNTALVHYTGTLVDGTVFDSSVTRGAPFEFPFGTGAVISGWDIGLNGMKVGEKRRLIIPPSYGYGENQVGPIPPNSVLVFDVELLEIK